jgi:hypothetical protein
MTSFVITATFTNDLQSASCHRMTSSREILISVEVSTGSRVRVRKFACLRRTWSFFNVAVHISIYGSSVIIVMWKARIGPKVYLERDREGISPITPPSYTKFKETSRATKLLCGFRKWHANYLFKIWMLQTSDLLNSFSKLSIHLILIGKYQYNPLNCSHFRYTSSHI